MSKSEHNRLYRSLAGEALRDVIQLIRSENVGPITFFSLIKRYNSASDALEAIPELAARGGSKRPLTLCPIDKANEELEHTLALGAQFLMYGSEHYPAALEHINDAPPLLIAWGNPALWHERTVLGMVGARNASAAGCAFTKKLAVELGKENYVIASGLARGIDTHAHEGSLSTGTVGVIAGGIDNIYPPENAALYDKLKAQGCIVTENPIGSTPQNRHFPARNRIIAGMSAGIIVCEAAQKSGSLITAHNALDYGREVFAIPGSPLDPRSYGANMLIRQGATLIQSAQDIIDQLTQTPAQHSLFEPETESFFSAPQGEPSAQELEKAHVLVSEKLSLTPTSIEEIIAQTLLPANILFTILLEKELAGMIQRHAGGKISLRFQDGS